MFLFDDPFSKADWQPQRTDVDGPAFRCGYCDTQTHSRGAYYASLAMTTNAPAPGFIRICTHCRNPTFFRYDGLVVPGPMSGEAFKHLPPEIHHAYQEARLCMTVSATTAAAMLCRKIIMAVAVDKGLPPKNERGRAPGFAECVSYLDDERWIPRGGTKWVQHVVDKGNEATHEIRAVDMAEAELLLLFVGLLLRNAFEAEQMVGSPVG
jgi:hypothetical protein